MRPSRILPALLLAFGLVVAANAQAQSCNENCNGSAGTGQDQCFCDNVCATFGDCCADVCVECGLHCGPDPAAPRPSAASSAVDRRSTM